MRHQFFVRVEDCVTMCVCCYDNVVVWYVTVTVLVLQYEWE